MKTRKKSPGHAAEVRPGVWELSFDLPRTEDNKRRQKCVTFHGGEIAAYKELTRLVAAAAEGKVAPGGRGTVEAYLSDWLRRREGEVAPKTLETWGAIVRAYVVPHIGDVALNQLTRTQVKTLYKTLETSGRRQGPGGLSRRTVWHVHRMLSAAFTYAVVELELLVRNPCTGAGPKDIASASRRRKILDLDQTLELLAAVRGTSLHAPVWLAAALGLRRGEALGLRWADIDFKRGTLEIVQTAQQDRIEGVVFRKPKTENSARVCTLPEVLAQELRQIKGQQAEYRLKMGPAWTDAGLVVQNMETGGVRSPEGLTHCFSAFMKKRPDLPQITFHDLRHCNTSLQRLAGVDIEIVSKRLGHCNVKTTQDIYNHVLPVQDAQGAAQFNELLRRVRAG